MSSRLNPPLQTPPAKALYAFLAIVLFVIASQGHLVHRADAGMGPNAEPTSVGPGAFNLDATAD